jgi:hypothetical protein
LVKKNNLDESDEVAFINRYYQNWGIPEQERMRPHFTMLYHPPFNNNDMKRTLAANENLTNQLNDLASIKFTRLGVVQIDSFGNPVKDGLLHVSTLHG